MDYASWMERRTSCGDRTKTKRRAETKKNARISAVSVADVRNKVVCHPSEENGARECKDHGIVEMMLIISHKLRASFPLTNLKEKVDGAIEDE